MTALSPVTEAIPKHDTSAQTRLRGAWLWIARVGWVVIFGWAATLLVWVFLAQTRFLTHPEYLLDVWPGCLRNASGAMDLAAFCTIGAHIRTELAPVLYLLAAAVIFWRKSDDRIALLTTLALVTIAARLVTGGLVAPDYQNDAWEFSNRIPGYLLLLVFLLLLYVFPDGILRPTWSLWLVAACAGLFVPLTLRSIELSFHIPALVAIADLRNLAAPLETPAWAIYGVCVLIGVVTQAYRYQQSSTQQQRQQSKWIIFAMAGIAFWQLIETALIPQLNLLGLTVREQSLVVLVTLALFAPVFLLLVPLSVGFAVLRYRLWDADFVISRTIIYGLMTIILVVLVGALLLAVSRLAESFAGGPLMALTGAALIFGIAFNPLQRNIRKFVDQRLYGIKLDYVEAVKAYGGTKRESRKTGDTKDTFGSYTGLTLLGRGGMGEVYRSQHPTLNRAVAIKILPEHIAGKADAEKRFLREAQTIAKLKHPNIVTLHDVGEQDGKPYMVMEYIDGQDLSDLLHERGRLPLDEALPILRDMAAALDYAHQNGVIHRDIKPSNVMVEKVTDPTQARPASFSPPLQGGGRGGVRAVLMDFGIAKSYAAGTKLTQTGMIGTLDYISPEQIQGASEVDARADVYSFGVMAYQILTGQLPFIHNNPGAMVLAHITQPAPDPREIVKDLPDSAALAVMRAMAKKPDQRYGTAGEFVSVLAA